MCEFSTCIVQRVTMTCEGACANFCGAQLVHPKPTCSTHDCTSPHPISTKGVRLHTTVPAWAKVWERVVPCFMMPLRIMKTSNHNLPQPPLSLNESNSEAFENSIVERNRALCFVNQQVHRSTLKCFGAAKYIFPFYPIVSPSKRKLYLIPIFVGYFTQVGIANWTKTQNLRFLIMGLPLQEEIHPQPHNLTRYTTLPIITDWKWP